MLELENRLKIIICKHSAAQTAVEQGADCCPIFKLLKKLIREMENLRDYECPIILDLEEIFAKLKEEKVEAKSPTIYYHRLCKSHYYFEGYGGDKVFFNLDDHQAIFGCPWNGKTCVLSSEGAGIDYTRYAVGVKANTGGEKCEGNSNEENLKTKKRKPNGHDLNGSQEETAGMTIESRGKEI